MLRVIVIVIVIVIVRAGQGRAGQGRAAAQRLQPARPPRGRHRWIVRTFIFLAGAPGAGKSTVAAIPQRRLGTPPVPVQRVPGLAGGAQGNRRLLARPPFPNEHFIDVAAVPTEEVADRIAGLT
jgi:hypothetical protein